MVCYFYVWNKLNKKTYMYLLISKRNTRRIKLENDSLLPTKVYMYDGGGGGGRGDGV